MTPDPESWAVEALDDELLRLSQQVIELRARQRYLTQIRDAKVAKVEMEARLSAMSDSEKAALAQIVGVDVATVSGMVRS